MKIGIDIDDTLLNSSESFERFKKENNIKFEKKFKDKWTNEEKDFIFKNCLDGTLKNATIKDHAIEVLKYLNLKNHELVIITARSDNSCKNIENITKQIFIDNKIKISEYYFGEYKKSDIAEKIKIDLMIDDNVNVYNNMKIAKIDCILFGDKIKDWEAVLEYIKKKEV